MIKIQNRELKFRAWLTKEKKMVSVHSIHVNSGTIIVTNGRYGNKSILPKDYILMEYIGIQDSDGNDIYEGDILKSNGTTAIVEWDDFIDQDFYWGNATGFKFNFNDSCNDEYHVIGNIYE